VKDAAFSLSQALPNANGNNNTAALDLNPEATGFLTNQWRLGYLEVAVPALSDHTNTSVTNKLALQHSAEAAANFANVDPQTEIQVVGVASTGSAARTVKVALPPGIKRYVRFNQSVPTNGGIGNNAAVTYKLVV
jgi:hypothetical protein